MPLTSCVAAGWLASVGAASAGSVPTLSIANTSVLEGTGPARTVALTVSLSHPADRPITVAFATADGSAVAGNDYVARSGTLVLPAGVLSRVVQVTILADAVPDEFDETFFVILDRPVHAGLGYGRAAVTIVDDDRELHPEL